MAQPFLLVISGISGCGKTTLARGLHLGACVSRDDIQTEINGWATPDGKKHAWDILQARIREYLKNGQSVTAEGMPFSRQSERRAMHDIAKECNAQLIWLHISCDTTTAQRHIQGQIHPAPDRNNHNIEKVAKTFEPFEGIVPHLILEAAWGKNIVLRRAQKFLSEFLPDIAQKDTPKP